MKKAKIFTGILIAISAAVMIIVPLLCSNMQGYYKSQISPLSDTKELLSKKQIWVQIGESPIFAHIFIACLITFLTVMVISYIRRKRK